MTSGEYPVHITLQLSPEVVNVLRKVGPDTHEFQEIAKALDDLSLSLQAMHPGVEDGVLASYFAVEVQDVAAAETALARLRSCAGVRAAYVKPPDELP